MIRLFVALPVPDVLVTAIEAIQTAHFPARWQTPEQLHLTLAFLGEVNDRDMAAVGDALGMVGGQAVSFALAGVGHFAEKGRAHSLWAGIAPREPVAGLAAKVAEACRRAGCPVSARRFVPHITVARLRLDERVIVPWLIAGGSLSSEAATVDRMQLIQSELHADGSRYTVLADFRLG